MKDLKEIASRFGVEASEVTPLGGGLINDTYLVSEAKGERYVLQRINHNVFRDVECLQRNVEAVTAHISSRLQEQGVSDIERRVLRFLKVDGRTYLHHDGSYWRMSVYIPDTVTRTEVNAENAYRTGVAFGEFEAMLVDIPVELEETIPDFHNMAYRLQQMREAMERDAAGRLEEVQELCEALLSREEHALMAERMYAEGRLPKRICHCDTKVDNILFSKEGEVLCVIDLDTVMPSFVFSDFGDFLRSAANTGKEDDENLDRVSFNMEIFRAFARGYVESAGVFLTPLEREMLPYAAERFPYMQAVRFLTDYLNGDTYYKTLYPTHNLVRTRAQLKLLESVESHLAEMQEYIERL